MGNDAGFLAEAGGLDSTYRMLKSSLWKGNIAAQEANSIKANLDVLAGPTRSHSMALTTSTFSKKKLAMSSSVSQEEASSNSADRGAS